MSCASGVTFRLVLLLQYEPESLIGRLDPELQIMVCKRRLCRFPVTRLVKWCAETCRNAQIFTEASGSMLLSWMWRIGSGYENASAVCLSGEFLCTVDHDPLPFHRPCARSLSPPHTHTLLQPLPLKSTFHKSLAEQPWTPLWLIPTYPTWSRHGMKNRITIHKVLLWYSKK